MSDCLYRPYFYILDIIRFGIQSLKQVVVIPMGSDYTPLVAALFWFNFMISLFDENSL